MTAQIPFDPASLAVGQSVSIDVEGVSILICRSQGGLHALPNRCPHQALSLDGARVRGESIICPHHGARFSLQDGKSLSSVTQNPVVLLPCQFADGLLHVDV